MLGTLYNATENKAEIIKSVTEFRDKFIISDEAEDKFHEAMHDVRFAGFKEGVKATLNLISELH